MFEQLRNEVLSKIYGKVTEEDLRIFMNALDVVGNEYEITKKKTSIVPYDYGMPELAKMYIVSRGIEGVAKASLKNYKIILGVFFTRIQKSPENVTANNIRAFLFNYQEEKGISNRTLDGYRIVINGFFSWASNEGYIPKNPCAQIKKIKYVKKPKKAMSQLELEYIRGACHTAKHAAIVEMLYSTGCRVSELSNIKKSDINWTRGEVQLFGKGSKYRTSYLNAKAIYAIQRYLEQRTDDNEYLFVSDRKPYTRLGKSGIERIIKILSDTVQENTGLNVTPHTFRHTTATVSLHNGMEITQIQRLLGHSNVSTTMEYAEVSQSDVSVMHAKCVV